MAAASPLEDLVSCPVCFEIYTDPKCLTCLHVLCKPCTTTLCKNGQVECPQCRVVSDVVNIKSDFNKQSLVDVYLNQTAASNKVEPLSYSIHHLLIAADENRSDFTCDSCEKSKEVNWWCDQCLKCMCNDCNKIHKSFPAIKDHRVITISDKVENIKSSARKTILSLKEQRDSLQKVEGSEMKYLFDVNKLKTYTIAEVNKYRENIKETIDKYHDDVIAELNAALENDITTADKRGKRLESMVKDCDTKMEVLSQLCNSDDAKTLLSAVSDIQKESETEMLKYAHEIEKSKRELVLMPKVEIHGPTNFKFKNGAKVMLTDAKTQIVTEIPAPTGTKMQIINYAEVFQDDPSFRAMCTVKTPKDPFRMFSVGKKIWCTMRDGLYIYNNEGQMIKCIKLARMARPCVVIPDSNLYMLATSFEKDGLHQFDCKGNYIMQVSDGKFSDIVMYKQELYALDWDERTVKVFRLASEHPQSWKLMYTIKLSCNSLDKLATIRINSNHIYVGSWEKSCIYKFTRTGKCSATKGRRVGMRMDGSLLNPRLSSVDEQNNIVVTDHANNRIQVFNDETDQWKTIRFTGLSITKPCDAVINEGGKEIWICDDCCQITKFVTEEIETDE